jgi:hypothetical protein
MHKLKQQLLTANLGCCSTISTSCNCGTLRLLLPTPAWLVVVQLLALQLDAVN